MSVPSKEFIEFQQNYIAFYASSDKSISFKINGNLEVLELKIQNSEPEIQNEIQRLINFAIKESSNRIKNKFNEICTRKR